MNGTEEPLPAERGNYSVMSSIDAVSCTWFTSSDRKHLVTLLFDESVDKQRKGLCRLATWNARSHPMTPLGMEVTASLLSALIASNEAPSDGSEEENSSKLLLGMSLVRFVNLVLQTKRVKAYPNRMIYNAVQMGIPDWLVEVRHSVAHSHMPSTKVLRRGAKWALSWLKQFYWDEESFADVPSTDCHRAEDAEKETIVRNLQTLRLDDVDLGYFENLMTNDIIDILMREGVVLPTADQLQSLANKERDVDNIGMELEQFWKRLFVTLHRPAVSFQLLTFLIEETAKTNDALQQRIGLTLTRAFMEISQPMIVQHRVELREILLSIPLNATSVCILEEISSRKKANRSEPNRGKKTSNWILQKPGEWKDYPIGMDRADGKWFPDKLMLELPMESTETKETSSKMVARPVKRKMPDEENKKIRSVVQQTIRLL